MIYKKYRNKKNNLFGVAVRLVTGSETLLPRITRKQKPLSTLQIRIFPSAQPVNNRR